MTSGRLPKNEQEIALAKLFGLKNIKIGQEIDLTEKAGSRSVLKKQDL